MTDIYFGNGDTFFHVQQSVNTVFNMVTDSHIPMDGFVCFTDSDDGDAIYIKKSEIVAFCKHGGDPESRY